MNKTGFVNKRQINANSSMKNTVGLLYSNLFQYKVTNTMNTYFEDKQEQFNSMNLLRSESEQLIRPNQLNPSSFYRVQISQKDKRTPTKFDDSDLSIRGDLQSSNKISLDRTKHTTNFGQTLVESQFGKNIKKFQNNSQIIKQHVQDENNKNIQMDIDKIKDKTFDKQERSFFNSSYVGKMKKNTSLFRDNNYQGNKLNKSTRADTQNNDKSLKNTKLIQQINQLNNSQDEPIQEVQEALQNIYKDDNQGKGKKSKYLKELFQQEPIDNTSKKKNKRNLQIQLSCENISSSSLNIEDDYNESTPNQKKLKNKNLLKQQTVNLEGFRLHRSFSEEDHQQNQQNQQNDQAQNAKLNQDASHQKKKSALNDLFEKSQSTKASNQFNNLYLDHYNRLGKEEWKTTKFQIGEFLWNARINQLKASIKKKMPAYSTVLLKQWEDYEYQPNTYATKRNISQHKEYLPPQKFKHSFQFYSPSSALVNQNYTNTLPSDIMQDKNQKIDKVSMDYSMLKKQNKQQSPYSTLQNNTSYERNLLSTAQSDYNQIYQTQAKYENSKREVQFRPPSLSTKGQDVKNYQKEFLQVQNKLKTRQVELKRIVQQINHYEQVTKNQPVVPVQLIDLAKKQSQTSFFQLQDIGRQKKTFRFFEKTPQYSTQEEVDDVQALKQLKQRSNTYKTFRNHVRQYLTLQKD